MAQESAANDANSCQSLRSCQVNSAKWFKSF